MTLLFDVAYAFAIFAAFLAVGCIPGFVLGLVVPVRQRRPLVLPAFAIALAGWLWFGVLGGTYGISRFGLAVFCAVGALGFVRGWVIGLKTGWRTRAAARSRGAAPTRARRSHTPASPR
jgi:hypothetical protein